MGWELGEAGTFEWSRIKVSEGIYLQVSRTYQEALFWEDNSSR